MSQKNSKSESAEPTNDERRAWLRFPSTPGTPSFSLAEEDEILYRRAKVRDISQGGAGLVVDTEYAEGVVVDLILSKSVKSNQLALQAKIMHVDKLDSGGYFLGCAFTRQLSENELTTFLKEGTEFA